MLITKIKHLLRPSYYAIKRKTRVRRSKAYFDCIKNKHAGRRGFVIGNGPSLQIKDLEKLVNEVTIASNKVYLAFDATSWRPDYFTVVDRLVWEKVQSDLAPLQLSPIIPSYLHELQSPSQTVRHLGSAADAYLADRTINFSDDLSNGMFGGYTVTFQNLQLAVHLGLNPIYIIGCDHFYSGEAGIEQGKPTTHKSKSNHFLPNYRAVGEIVNPAPIEKMNAAYAVAATYAKQNGIQIFNATRGGHLDAFPRTDFDAIAFHLQS
jgi:hypothetical protein